MTGLNASAPSTMHRFVDWWEGGEGVGEARQMSYGSKGHMEPTHTKT